MAIELDLALFAAGAMCWAISIFSAGGGSLLILAVVSLLLGMALASLMAGPARAIALWSRID
jgi:membrane-bound ClpP family serine protease